MATLFFIISTILIPTEMDAFMLGCLYSFMRERVSTKAAFSQLHALLHSQFCHNIRSLDLFWSSLIASSWQKEGPYFTHQWAAFFKLPEPIVPDRSCSFKSCHFTNRRCAICTCSMSFYVTI